MELLQNVRLLENLSFLSITAYTTVLDLETLFREEFGYPDVEVHFWEEAARFTIKCFEEDERVVDIAASIGDVVVVNEVTGVYVVMAHEVFLNVFNFGSTLSPIPNPSLN